MGNGRGAAWGPRPFRHTDRGVVYSIQTRAGVCRAGLPGGLMSLKNEGRPRPLAPVEDVLEILDQTVTELSRAAVEFTEAAAEHEAAELPCQYQWHKLEKAALALIRAREIDDPLLGSISLLRAKKDLVSRALALMECWTATGGQKDAVAPNLRHPTRRTRKHPWGKAVDDGDNPEEGSGDC